MQPQCHSVPDGARKGRLESLLEDGGPPGLPPSGISPSFSSRRESVNQQLRHAAAHPVHMARLHLCGQACRFSPFADNLIAVATSQLFGMAGPGALEVLTLQQTTERPRVAPEADDLPLPRDVQAHPSAVLQPRRVALLSHKQPVNDVAWSETNAQILVGGGGGGAITIWWLSGASAAVSGVQGARDFGGVWVRELKGHTRDIVSLSWSCVDKRLMASAALDGQVRVWDMQQGAACRVLHHTNVPASCCCNTSPADAGLVASVGADGRLAVHDLRRPAADRPSGPSWSITAHPCEALCVDWMKHRPWQLVTGAADGSVALWDLRRSASSGAGDSGEGTAASSCQVSSTHAHQLAVRRVASHPFSSQRFASCSYDMHVKVWDSNEGTSITMENARLESSSAAAAVGAPSPFVDGSGWMRLHACFDHHREFILGLDWSTFTNGRIMSTSWDRTVCVWNSDAGLAPPLVPKRPLFLSMKPQT
ncbi:hypothetical protein Efla_005862 [Eimeria flavescens]